MTLTPEERARDIMDTACLGEPWAENGVDAALRRDIAAAIREAELAEREECVRICDEAANDLDDEGNAFFAVIVVRDAIRSRSSPPAVTPEPASITE